MEAAIISVGGTILVFMIGQTVWVSYKIGRLESKGNGYVKCPFFRRKENPHDKR